MKEGLHVLGYAANTNSYGLILHISIASNLQIIVKKSDLSSLFHVEDFCKWSWVSLIRQTAK